MRNCSPSFILISYPYRKPWRFLVISLDSHRWWDFRTAIYSGAVFYISTRNLWKYLPKYSIQYLHFFYFLGLGVVNVKCFECVLIYRVAWYWVSKFKQCDSMFKFISILISYLVSQTLTTFWLSIQN